MKRNLLIALFALIALPTIAHAAKMMVGETNAGSYHTLKIVGGDSSSAGGGVATVDVQNITDLTVLPTASTDPVLTVTATEGSDETFSVSHYETSSASKKGTIQINVNGTTRYINFYDDPD